MLGLVSDHYHDECCYRFFSPSYLLPIVKFTSSVPDNEHFYLSSHCPVFIHYLIEPTLPPTHVFDVFSGPDANCRQVLPDWETMLKPTPLPEGVAMHEDAMKNVTVPLNLESARQSILEFKIPDALFDLPVCPLHPSTRAVLMNKEWISTAYFPKHLPFVL